MTVYTVPFDSEACRDVREVGGKALGLAEMTAAGLPVAPGFTVTAAAYRDFLDENGLRDDVRRILGQVDPDDRSTYDAAERALTERLSRAPLPARVADEVRRAYAELNARIGGGDVPVAVRSSATAEDSGGDSFAGEFETWVDVVGAEDVLAHVHRCYLSVFTGRVLSYAVERGIDLRTVEMAVVVQKTVRARSAGVMFTLDPITGDRSRIVLESSWGLGLSVVGGEVTPDRYVVNKVGLSLDQRVLGDKRVEYRRGDRPVPVPEDRRERLCLEDHEVLALAALGRKLEQLQGRPQDIEFAIDEDLPQDANLVLLQCRPETVWSSVKRAPAFDAGTGLMSWIVGSIGAGARTPAGAGDGHGHGGHRHG
ncbi:PEP/pyruvate-binding domain-containing protein [Microbispora sp. H10836]|uniref:PEP/pyruvate-binding domain-containing protein n=1 Tax=Microbispora sp. H10836 TaxID=2729106 RepID=UPI001473ACB5|nr:PEP/pyruvate-binding domain-containing protein [Microbispora sp. H10836]